MSRRIQIGLLGALGIFLSIFLCTPLQGQTVIFNDPGPYTYTNTDGPTMDDFGPIDISNCSSINFSMDYSFSLPWEGFGNMETSEECDNPPIDECPGDPTMPTFGGCDVCWDFLWVRVFMDGTEVASELIGDAGTTDAQQMGTITFNGICTDNYSDLTIEVQTQTWASDESVTFENIVVECYDDSPVAEATPNPVCEGEDLQLDETSGSFSSWTWSGPNGFSSTMQNPVINNVVPADAGTYTVEVQDPNGCSVEDQVTVNVAAPPSYNTIDLNGICSDEADPFDLTVYEDSISMQGGVTITFYEGEPGNGGSVIPNPSSVDLNALSSLWAEVDNGNCSVQFMIPISITPAPMLDPVSDVTACTAYTLPSISGSNLGGANTGYYTQPNGQGTEFQPGDQVTSSWDPLYIYAVNGNCSDETTFEITIESPPDLDPISDVTTCTSYTLPSITGTNLAGNEAYYTGPNQTGSMYNPGETITSSTTLYATSGDPSGNCYDEEQFQVTILDQPDIDPINDITECGYYILPTISGTNLTGNEAYYDQMNGNGNSWQEGDTIFSSMTLYAYDDNGSCSDEESFSVTIDPAPDIDPIMDVTACMSYTLPSISGTNLTGNQAYYTGPDQSGTMYSPGDNITSTTTLYAADGTPGSPCYDEEQFQVTILDQPDIDPINDVTECTFYVLPPISGSNLTGNEAYYDQMNGNGNSWQEGDTIFSSTTLYAFDGSGNCTDEESFNVTIDPAPDIDTIMDVTACTSYTLPGISGTNLAGNEAYYTGPDQSGTMYSPGDDITSSTLLYATSGDPSGNCYDEESFQITILDQPDIDPIDDVTRCDHYVLPLITGMNLTGNQAYFNQSGGSGTSWQAGDTIFSSMTVYAYDDNGACSDEESFQVTINPAPDIDPIMDITACESYTLPGISGTNLAGNEAYYTVPNQGGTMYSAGDDITSSTTLYATSGDPVTNCYDEESFQVTILDQPDINPIDDVTACTSYTLPSISGSMLDSPAYYTGTGGSGTQYNPGDIISSSTTLYAFDGSMNCTDEEAFDITILPQEDPSFSYDDYCLDSTAMAYDIQTPGGTFSFDMPPGDGAGIDPVSGELFGETANTYFIEYITPGTCPDTSVEEVTVYELPEFINVTTICDPNGNTYSIEVESTGDQLDASNGTVTDNGGGDFTVDDISNGTTVTLTLTNTLTGCDNVSAPSPPNCSCPQIDPIDDTTACNFYVLPPISGNNLPSGTAYYDGAGGSGTMYAAGDTLFSSTSLFAYYDTGNCSDEEPFDVTIDSPPQLDSVNDVTACQVYTLPPISGMNISNAAYYTQSGGMGQQFSEGDSILTSDTLYIYAGSPGCEDEVNFSVSVLSKEDPAFNFDDFCIGSDNGPYSVETPGGTYSLNPQPGDSATIDSISGEISNETVNAYTVQYITPGTCPDTAFVTVDVRPLPDYTILRTECFAAVPFYSVLLGLDTSDITVSSDTGTISPAGEDSVLITTIPNNVQATITLTSTFGCEVSFTTQPPPCNCPFIYPINDTSSCENMVLPPISGSSDLPADVAYYTGMNGSGTTYEPGDTIDFSTTLYAYYEQDSCSSEQSIYITLGLAPDLEKPADIFTCGFYVLPPITANPPAGNEAYYTAPNGGGQMYEAGDTITTTGTYYLYGGFPGCSDEESFDINVNPQTDIESPGNLAGCDSVVLPPINGTNLVGNEAYYTGSGGTGTTYNAGDVITSSTTLFIFGGVQDCPDQEMIEIKVSGPPNITAPFSYESCNFFELQPISGNPLFGNEAYYTEPGGNGSQYNPGDTIFSSDTLYIYGGTSGCSDEEDVFIYVYPAPQFEAVQDTSVCGSFVLPDIEGTNLTGNAAYYTDSMGSGTMYLPGDTLDSSEELFIYDEISGCRDEVQFDLTVHDIPTPQPLQNQAVCVGDSLILYSDVVSPDWTFYWGGPNGFSDTGSVVVVTDSATLQNNATYFVVAESDYCTSDTFTIDAFILDRFNYSLNDTTVCSASSPINLNALYGLPDTLGSWSGTDVTNGMLSVSSFPATYTLEYSATGFCQSQYTVSLQLHSEDERTGLFSQDLCAGDTIDIDGTMYHAGNSTDTIIYPNSSAFGCDSILVIDLNILPVDSATLDRTLCTGESLTINGTVYDANNPTGTEVFPGQAANGCDSVLTVTLDFTDAVTEDLNPTICPGDTIYVAGTPYHEMNPSGQEIIPGGSQAGCDSIINVDLSTRTIDTNSIDETLCPGESLVVNGTTYDESNPSGIEVLNDQSVNGCDSVIRIDLNFDMLSIAYETSAPTCIQPESGTLTISDASGASFDLLIQGIDSLSGQGAPLTVDGIPPGNYSAVLSYGNGNCEQQFDFDIPDYSPPQLSLGQDLEIQAGSSITLEAMTNFDPIQVQWTPASLTGCDTCTSVTFSPQQDMTISATAWAADTISCAVSDSINLRILASDKVYIPNAFTPNNDGINDLFSVYSGGDIRRINSMRIFNRWGDLVYEIQNASPTPSAHGWDGRFNGQRLEPGVFVYAIEVEFPDGRTRLYKGEVTLIR